MSRGSPAYRRGPVTIALVAYDYAVPSAEFCQELFDLNGTLVTPGACFGVEHAFRIGYANSREMLEGGLAGVSAYLRVLEGRPAGLPRDATPPASR